MKHLNMNPANCDPKGITVNYHVKGQAKSYVELSVPISITEEWYKQLVTGLKDLPIKWKHNTYKVYNYHITLAFFNSTPPLDQIKTILTKYLNGKPAPVLVFDKYDVFEGINSHKYYITLTASNVLDSFNQLKDDFRMALAEAGFDMNDNFRLHVTLGEMRQGHIALEELQSRVNIFSAPSVALLLNEANYKGYGRSTFCNQKTTFTK